MKNSKIMQISQQIAVVQQKIQEKACERQKISLENAKIKKIIEEELTSHEETVVFLQENLQNLQNLQPIPENSQNINENIRLSQENLLKRQEITMKASELSRLQAINREKEAIIADFTKKLRELQRELQRLQVLQGENVEKRDDCSFLSQKVAEIDDLLRFHSKKHQVLQARLQKIGAENKKPAEKLEKNAAYLQKHKKKLENYLKKLKKPNF